MAQQESRGYHWIRKEIQKHDPETEYGLIWRLMTSYHLSDFMNNLIYALTFPNFIVVTHGAEVVWREDGGKVAHKGTQRVEETENNNMTWWYYGPDDPRTKKSVDDINKRHVFWARRYPGHFSHNEDYIYTLAFSVILMHRLRLRLGLSGFSEKEKIAAHHFWRDMTPLFYAEDKIPLHSFPEDWDSCIEFCESFEHRPKPFTPKGQMIATAIYEQFAFRYFPPALHWLGKSIPVALSLETTLDTLKIRPVHPLLKWIIVFVVGRLLWLAELLLPDPHAAFLPTLENLTPEDQKTRRNDLKTLDKGFSQHFTQRHGQNFPGCPFADAKSRIQLPDGFEKFT
ncbi:hypothetical protein UCRPC4_g05394 [Phaeomoniella chlamydospora]|uniref:ER-bound oxygenase mpaB/mpaB'/Rubber oxygenase catalytic domain-containing protein n=1 Tax=Phaeomoniella chlamydospora TaxID=158046 RepID=A0A0G2E5Y5_PHACM|nr:hypothetical protein UCRPC4_g05394 [Phaeomoniella chlamydospora]